MGLLSVLIAIAAFWYALNAARAVALSTPNQQREAVQGLHEAVVALRRDLDTHKLEADARLDSQTTKLVSWRTDIEGLLEAVEDTLERVERKRRSASAAASRATRGQAGELDPTNPEHLKQIARQRGIDVM